MSEERCPEVLPLSPVVAHLRGGPSDGFQRWASFDTLTGYKGGVYVVAESLGPSPLSREFFFDWVHAAERSER